MRVFETPNSLDDAVGDHLGFSDWALVTQDMVNAFAETTGDRQWIHVDPDRAVDGPFGSTIAHGFLTLSMIGGWSGQIFEIRGCSMVVNYGLERVRFLTPVPIGSRVRAGAELTSVTPAGEDRRVNVTFTVELEGSDRPALVAETVLVAAAARGAAETDG